VSALVATTCWIAQPLQDLQTHADGNHPSPAARINRMLQRLMHCKEFNVSAFHSAHQGTSEHLICNNLKIKSMVSLFPRSSDIEDILR
jgi:hypothetical protein